MTEELKECPNEAVFIVPWAGKLLKECEIHTRGLLAIGNAIGETIEIERINPFDTVMCMSKDDLKMYEQAKKENEEKKEVAE